VFIMPNDRRSRAVLAATLLLMGCQAAPPSLRPIKALRPEIETVAPRPGALRMMVRQEAITPAMAARFGLLDVQQLDWDTVRVWLANSRDGDSGRPGFVTRRLRGFAIVDNATNVRTSSLIFDDLTPSDGYSIFVRLYRGGDQVKFDTAEATATIQDTSPEMIASGSSTDFQIRSGANTVNVSLTLSPGGRFNVSVDEPATTVNQTIAGQFDIATQSHYTYGDLTPTHGDVDGVTGDSPPDVNTYELAGLARESTDAGTIYFTVPGRNQIFSWNGSAIALLAGTGTVTAADYNNAGDYGDARNATLSDPRGIVRASGDNHIIFCDKNNGRIRILRPGNLDPNNNEPLASNDAPTYRIETLIGGGATALTEGANATDALKVQLASPTAIVADDDGTLYFTEESGNFVNTYRYDGVVPGGNVTLISQVALTGTRGTGEHYGALAIDRRSNLLWVSTGENRITVLSGIASPTLTVTAETNLANAIPAASWVVSTDHVKALAFDQTAGRGYNTNTDRWGTLFFTAQTNASGTVLYRVPVTNSGLIPSYREPEPIAGGGITSLAANRARGLASMALGWGSLLVDLYQSDQSSTDTRILAGRSNLTGDWVGTSTLLYEFKQVEGINATTTLDDVTNP
jgi:hypothetical protein